MPLSDSTFRQRIPCLPLNRSSHCRSLSFGSGNTPLAPLSSEPSLHCAAPAFWRLTVRARRLALGSFYDKWQMTDDKLGRWICHLGSVICHPNEPEASSGNPSAKPS